MKPSHRKALANPLGSFGEGMDLQSCLALGQKARHLHSPHRTGIGCRVTPKKRGMTLKEAALLAQSNAWRRIQLLSVLAASIPNS